MILVARAPALLTVQDRGWRTSRALGLPVSGAMDPWALRLGNALVGNEDGAAALEWALGAGRLRFEEAAMIALTGATLEASLEDGSSLAPYERIAVPRGATLRVEGVTTGCFAYLAVAGGIATPLLLGSRSTYLPTSLGGLDGRALRPGDRVPIGAHHAPARGATPFSLPAGLLPAYDASHVRLVPGPQRDPHESELLAALYTVGDESDRMGYRLTGGAPRARLPQLLPSEGACAGAVQLPESGDPIVLMADGPTVGGYAKVGVVIGADLPILAQRVPRAQVRFTAVSVERAQQLFRRREVDLHTARALASSGA